jgi:hypothetical protein
MFFKIDSASTHTPPIPYSLCTKPVVIVGSINYLRVHLTEIKSRSHFDWPITIFFKYWALPILYIHESPTSIFSKNYTRDKSIAKRKCTPRSQGGSTLAKKPKYQPYCVVILKFNFGHSKWNKSVMLLGTSQRTLWEFNRNTLGIVTQKLSVTILDSG